MKPSNEQAEGRTAPRTRSRRGAVAVLTLILAVICVILLQSFSTNVISDMTAAASLDRYMQHQGERIAVERIVKEALLQFYERPRMADPPGGLGALINGMLANMQGEGSMVNYSLDTARSTMTVPINGGGNSAGGFWPDLNLSSGTSVTNIDDNYELRQLANPNGLSLRGCDRVMPAGPPAMQVTRKNGAANEQPIFRFVVQRTVTGQETVDFTVIARMWQVPVSDFNLVSYAIANSEDSIPASPPTLSAGLRNDADAGTIHTLCLSKMPAGNAIQLDATYPYYYRDIFSAGSLAWEWFTDRKTYTFDYLGYNSNDEDHRYFWHLTSCAQDARHEASYGVLPDIPDVGFSYIEQNASGSVPRESYWQLDLQTLRDGANPAVDSERAVMNDLPFRKVYIYVPPSLGTDVEHAGEQIFLRITDSNPGNVLHPSANHWENASKPVIIFLNGRQNVTTHDYIVELDGDLRDQPVFIMAAGVNIRCNDTRINGALILEPGRAVFTDSGHAGNPPLTVNGLLAFDGGVANVMGGLDLADGDVVVGGLATNPFRPIAPRFLVVDTESTMTIHPE